MDDNFDPYWSNITPTLHAAIFNEIQINNYICDTCSVVSFVSAINEHETQGCVQKSQTMHVNIKPCLQSTRVYTEHKISASLNCVTVRGKGKMERARGGGANRHLRYRFPSLPVPRQAGHHCVYLQRSTNLGDILRQEKDNVCCYALFVCLRAPGLYLSL
jgi:hypothetical protein